MQSANGTEKSQGWVCLLRRQGLQVHHLVPEGSGGNLWHVSGPGSQDHVRVSRAEFQARFVDRESMQVPYPLDEGQCNQEYCFTRQNF